MKVAMGFYNGARHQNWSLTRAVAWRAFIVLITRKLFKGSLSSLKTQLEMTAKLNILNFISFLDFTIV